MRLQCVHWAALLVMIAGVIPSQKMEAPALASIEEVP